MKLFHVQKIKQHFVDKILLSIGRIVLVVFLSMQFVLPLVVTYKNIYVTRTGYDSVPSDHGLKYQVVDFFADDKTLLKGWYIPKENSLEKGPGILLVHGLRANKSDLLDVAVVLHNEGFSVLLFDLRGHGLSDGRKVTYGDGESMDIEAALRALSQQKDIDEKRIGIYAVSLGASSAIIAETDSDFVKKYNKALFLDSPYSSLEKLLERQFPWTFGYITPLSKILTKQFSKLFLTKDPFLNEPISKVRKIEVPLFLTHGAEDRLIPKEHSVEIFENKVLGKKELLIVPLSGHLEGRALSHGEYDKKMIQFFKENL